MPVYQKFRIIMEMFNINIFYKYVDGKRENFRWVINWKRSEECKKP